MSSARSIWHSPSIVVFSLLMSALASPVALFAALLTAWCVPSETERLGPVCALLPFAVLAAVLLVQIKDDRNKRLLLLAATILLSVIPAHAITQRLRTASTVAALAGVPLPYLLAFVRIRSSNALDKLTTRVIQSAQEQGFLMDISDDLTDTAKQCSILQQRMDALEQEWVDRELRNMQASLDFVQRHRQMNTVDQTIL